MKIPAAPIVLAIFALVPVCARPQPVAQIDLCELQTSVPEGAHRTVRVEGIFLPGMEGQELVDPHCSSRSTFVDFVGMPSNRMLDRLWKITDKRLRKAHVHGDGVPVHVIFEGEFFGPPAADPKLPESIRRNYHPGWDSNSKTKLVVSKILSVKALPRGDPCAPKVEDEWPCWQKDVLPPAPAK
jgi:hypothetical protein